jgi:ABC-type iron transport system FetAB ATPase subunit
MGLELAFVPSTPAVLGGCVVDNLTIPPAAATAITVGLWLV